MRQIAAIIIFWNLPIHICIEDSIKYYHHILENMQHIILGYMSGSLDVPRLGEQHCISVANYVS